MKQFTCELCGSTDVIKQDGMFVCRGCGTKYSIEEAKKMMVEGTADVSVSTAKADTSDELSNLYQIARRAKDDNNAENAAKYYDMILVKDPNSWEAAFYVVYFKAMQCKIAQISSAANSVTNCESSVLSLIKNNVPESEQLAAVTEIVFRSSLIAHMLASAAKSHYDGINSEIRSNYTSDYVNNVTAASILMFTCGDLIDLIFVDMPEIRKMAATAWMGGNEIVNQLLPVLPATNLKATTELKATIKETVLLYTKKIGKYDPQYEIDTLKKIISSTPMKQKFNGCGIFLIVIGAIWLFLIVLANGRFGYGYHYLPIHGLYGLARSDSVWPIIIVASGVLLGILLRKPYEKNCKIVSDAKEELAKKEEELKKLTYQK